MAEGTDQQGRDDMQETEADLTFGDFIDIERRINTGAEVSDEERAAYANRPRLANAHKLKSVIFGKAPTAIAAKLREGDKALRVVDSMPPQVRQAYEHRTVAQTRRDPVFQMYARRLRAPAPRLQPRPIAQGCSRPRARRSSSSSRTSGTDPGDGSSDGSSDPPPPPALAPNGAASRVALAWLLTGADVLAAEVQR